MEFGEDAGGGMLALAGQLIGNLISDGAVPPYQMTVTADNKVLFKGYWSADGEDQTLTFHETARYASPGTGERVAILFVDAKGQRYVTRVVPPPA